MADLTITIHGDAYEVCDYRPEDAEAIVLPDLSQNNWREPDEIGTNGADSLYIWHLGNDSQLEVYDAGGALTASLNYRRGLSAVWPTLTMAGAWKRLLEGRAAVSYIYKVLQRPAPNYDGPCRIWCEPNYYQGTFSAPQPDYARDEHGKPLEFATPAQAEAYVDDYYNAPSGYDGIRACNILSHGQAGADTLTIVVAKKDC